MIVTSFIPVGEQGDFIIDKHSSRNPATLMEETRIIQVGCVLSVENYIKVTIRFMFSSDQLGLPQLHPHFIFPRMTGFDKTFKSIGKRKSFRPMNEYQFAKHTGINGVETYFMSYQSIGRYQPHYMQDPKFSQISNHNSQHSRSYITFQKKHRS
jgi:hypothetical protein